jgi:hypothetical protein
MCAAVLPKVVVEARGEQLGRHVPLEEHFMRTRNRRTLAAGTAAGLTLVLASPFVASANAHDRGGPETGRHGWHSVSNPAEHTAKKALKAAIKAANAAYKTSVRTATKAFFTDPAVIAARAARVAVVKTSTDPALISAANDAYAAAVAGPLAARDLAVEAALATWITSVDAAYTAYDTATLTPAEAAAKATFRTSVRAAALTFKAAEKSAKVAFRSATAPAHAQLRASVNAAVAVYLASPKSDSDKATFGTAIHAARDAFKADGAVVAAKAAKVASITSARTAYKAAVQAARDTFFAATGHNPMRWKPILPKVHS